jgi:hypothetical protein
VQADLRGTVTAPVRRPSAMTERDTEIEFDFFEESATRETVRPERTGRRARRPGRPPGPPSGLTPLLRLVGLISFAILVVVLLVFWVSSCRGEQKKDRYAGYMEDVTAIARDSATVGRQLNTALTRPEVRRAELIRTIDGFAQQQLQLVANAQRLDPPGPLRAQHEQMVDALQFRVSGLRGLADMFRARQRNAARAGALLASQARRLVASDVVWDDLFREPAAQELERQDGLEGIRVPDSNFVENPDLATARSMESIWGRVSGGGATGGGGGQQRPGLHGHGLVSTRVLGGAQLSTEERNEIVATTDLAFEVTFENSGDSTETGVQVTLTIQKTPEPIVKTETVDLTEPGTPSRVVFRDVGAVPFVQETSVKVEIGPMPEETNVANNSAEYPVIFSYPGG